MKIGIAAPCPQPFVIGGAEKLWWGLAQYINASTSHQADIIKLPVAEDDFWSLVDAYERFARLHLTGFDVVISGKYPAWMVQHPQHVVYMLHPARGLYEGYSGDSLEQARPRLDREVTRFIDWLQPLAPSRTHLDAVFDRLAALRASDRERGGSLLQWPGPVTRAVVRWLDAAALAPGAIARYAAIAHGLARRDGYFPPGPEVVVAHPPSDLPLRPGPEFRYLLAVGRLEGYKRVALIAEAMRAVEGEVELWIAGTGPEDSRLREQAAADPRIRFVGFVNDDALVDLYRGALGVLFVPYQEDYGLVTIEAMMAGKPVVTTTDSGGPTELVRDGVNGYVVAPTAPAIAAAMQRLVGDHELAQRLGAAGHERAEQVTWPRVLEALLPQSSARRKSHCATDDDGRGQGAPDIAWATRLAYVSSEQRSVRKRQLGLDAPLVVAIGGRATDRHVVDALCSIASSRPDIAFIAPLGALEAGALARIPRNLSIPGDASRAAMEIICEAADVAVCLAGDGAPDASIVFACFATGVPVVATPEARAALPEAVGEHWQVCVVARIPEVVDGLLADPALALQASAAARQFSVTFAREHCASLEGQAPRAANQYVAAVPPR